jgi:hypothetical protein
VVILLREKRNTQNERVNIMTSTTNKLLEELKASYPNCEVGPCVGGDGDYENTIAVEGGDIRGCLLFWIGTDGAESSWSCY